MKYSVVLGMILAWGVAVTPWVALGADISIYPETPTDEALSWNRFGINYFGIFYGPSIKNASSYQPTPMGDPDFDRPLLFKNFLTLGYNLTDRIVLAGSAFWLYQPVMGQQMALQNPFLRIADTSILHSNNLNLYADLRTHFGISNTSRQADERFSLQHVQALTYALPGSRFMVGVMGSAWAHFYGRRGEGADLELFVAPNIEYQLSPTVALTLLYEMQAHHEVGGRAFKFVNDGTDLEPGVNWAIRPNLLLNPYLIINTGGKISLSSTAIGFMLNWSLM